MKFLSLCYYADTLYVRCDLHKAGCYLFKGVKDGKPIKTNVDNRFAQHHANDGLKAKYDSVGELDDDAGRKCRRPRLRATPLSRQQVRPTST